MTILLKKVMYDCPFCEKEHEMIVREEPAVVKIKNEMITYTKVSYYCEEEKEEFCPKQIMDSNLLLARNAYREQTGLLTSEDIKNIRDKYQVTQKEFSNLLGWGDITVQRYESKVIQDPTYDYVMRLCGKDPYFCLEMLEINRDRFKKERFMHLKVLMEKFAHRQSVAYYRGKLIDSSYSNYREPSIYNGWKPLNKKKMSAVSGFYASFISDLTKSKLLRLLWLTDKCYFEKYHLSMMGLVYRKSDLGLIPLELENMFLLSAVEIKEEVVGGQILELVKVEKEVSIKEFEREDIDILKVVLDNYGALSDAELSEKILADERVLNVPLGEVFSYDVK